MVTISNTKLRKELEKRVETFCNELLQISDIIVKSINIYGKDDKSILIVAEELKMKELKAIRDIVADFRKFGINIFFITESTLMTSTDVFPIKFMIIKESSFSVYGEDILKSIKISDEYLRLRCEQEIKELFLKIKKYYLDNYGMRLMDIMKDTVESFIQSLRVLVALKTGKKPCFEECVKVSAELVGFDGNDLERVKNLKNLSEKPKQEIREEIFGGYLEVVHSAAKFVDEL